MRPALGKGRFFGKCFLSLSLPLALHGQGPLSFVGSLRLSQIFQGPPLTVGEATPRTPENALDTSPSMEERERPDSLELLALAERAMGNQSATLGMPVPSEACSRVFGFMWLPGAERTVDAQERVTE